MHAHGIDVAISGLLLYLDLRMVFAMRVPDGLVPLWTMSKGI